MNRLLTQGEIERMILDITNQLEEETYTYATLSDEAASAEADYKLSAARQLLAIAASGRKLTAPEKQATVDVACSEAFRIWKIAEARRGACKEALLSLRARLDAQRSLAANIRAQT
jgi:hypothetical protein